MNMNGDELREVFSKTDIEERIDGLSQEINRDYMGRELVVIGILKGAFIFLADIVRRLSMDVAVDFVRLSSYGSNMESSGKITFSKDIEIDIASKDVLLIEDIIDTGYTIKYLMDVLRLKSPASIKVCCLIDKVERRKVEVQAHYVGFKVDRGFLVGYGLDYNERYRHLPAIYHLNPPYSPSAYSPSDR